MNESKDRIRLAEQAVLGDRKAFLALAEELKIPLYRTARSILDRDEDCADAMQETLLKAMIGVHHLKHPQFFRSWIYRILINECRSMLRKQKKISLPGELPVRTAEAEGYGNVELREAIGRLKEPLRLVITLVYLEDLTVEETAGALGISGSAVKMRLKRARSRLREMLEEVPQRGKTYESTRP